MRRARARCLLAGALSLFTLAVAPDVMPAQSPAPPPAASSVRVPPPGEDAAFDARVAAVASRLRCPVCQGESIQDSPAELAVQMKALVREQLAQGRTDADVMAYFAERYGQWILLEPRAEGINLLVYWLPIAFLLGGGVALWSMVHRWTRAAAGASPHDESSGERASRDIATPPATASGP